MTTEKQTEANQENALQSTGPQTAEGKAIVSKNAVKHGIFTGELIIEQGDGKEDRKEYEELLQNLIDYFNPQGQLEAALVEKIAVDFWRLKRVIRFETGSIRKQLDYAIDDYFGKKDWEEQPKHKSNEDLDKEIKEFQESLWWNRKYLKCLQKGEVDLTKETWENDEIESDIPADYYLVLNRQKHRLKGLDIDALESEEMSLEQMKAILEHNSYDLSKINQVLIEHYQSEVERLKSEIKQIEVQKARNKVIGEIQKRLKVLPAEDIADKVLRYERSIEKSIFQKIIMLKNLQGSRTA